MLKSLFHNVENARDEEVGVKKSESFLFPCFLRNGKFKGKFSLVPKLIEFLFTLMTLVIKNHLLTCDNPKFLLQNPTLSRS